MITVPYKCQLTKLALVVALSFSLSGFAAAAAVTDEDIAKDASVTSSVLSNGLGVAGHRYSPLDKINTTTVQGVVPAFAFSFGGEKQRGQQSQPLVHNGKIFVTGSYSRAFAVDAKTGSKIWQYDHRLPDGILPCCDVINRGGALYDDLFIFATLDAQIVALNQDTGKVVWRERIADYKDGYSATAAPIIVKGMLITGNSGGEFGVVGQVDARDPKTGKVIWTRPTIQGHMGTLNGEDNGITGEDAEKSWPGDTWQTGGGAPWMNATYDADTDTIFMGTGNPAPWNSHMREGDNLYTSSVLALDPATGKIKWHYQYTPNDAWDFDGVNANLPFDLEKDGETIKAIAHADRNGFFYVINRETGKLINATPFVSGITWAEKIDLETGRPVRKEEGSPGDPGEGEKGESVFAVPGFLGATNWMPPSYSPHTKLFYVSANEWGMDIWNEPITYRKGAAYLGAGFNIKPLHEEYIGSFRAINPATGEIVWESKNNAPLWSSSMTTAGNLVFHGTPEGYLRALNAETGEELWKFQTGSGVIGQPVTWEQDGEQYIAVSSGWGGAVPLWGGEVASRINYLNQGGMLWVFKLPQEAQQRLAAN